MKVLVTGGVRSGKSFHAESLLLAAAHVTYVAPGPTIEEESDPDWTAPPSPWVKTRPANLLVEGLLKRADSSAWRSARNGCAAPRTGRRDWPRFCVDERHAELQRDKLCNRAEADGFTAQLKRYNLGAWRNACWE